MIVARIIPGITNHFPYRKCEWAGLWFAFGMGVALHLQPEMFETSPSFRTLASWAEESVWSVFVLLVAVNRLVALVVNGTFASFPYSPLMRLFASLAGLAFWAIYCLGFLSSAIYSGGSWSAVVMYSGASVIEVFNWYQSVSDMRRRHGAR